MLLANAVLSNGWRKSHMFWRESVSVKVIRSVGLLLVIFVGLLSGCSGGKDKKAATEAINQGLKRELVMVPISVGRVGDKCGDEPAFVTAKDLTAQTNYHSVQKAGLVTIATDGPDFWKVELVDPKPVVLENLKKARHNTRDGCDAVAFSFLVAAKSVADIVSIHEVTDQKSEVEFTWKWALAPAGVKLVDKLTQQEIVQLNANLQDAHRNYRPDPTFNLADMVLSSTPHPGKKTLKKSGDGWLLDE